MKHHIIQIRRYPLSMQMAHKALESAQTWGWDAELFNGLDGSLFSADMMQQRWGVKICTADRKTHAMFQDLPGVRGCFMSHWSLWQLCRDRDEPMGIYEHDVLFRAAPQFQMPRHMLKLEGFSAKPARPAGVWYEGARAYIITPRGADRLLTWVDQNGCLPTDVTIGEDVVDIEFDDHELIALQINHGDKHSAHTNSFTWNLSGMTRT